MTLSLTNCEADTCSTALGSFVFEGTFLFYDDMPFILLGQPGGNNAGRFTFFANVSHMTLWLHLFCFTYSMSSKEIHQYKCHISRFRSNLF